MKLSDLLGTVQTNEYVVYDKDIKLAVTFDREMNKEHGETKIKRIFRVLEDDELEEIPVEKMVDDLATALVHTIDPKLLIKKVLEEMMPNDLIKAHKIIKEHPEAAQKAKTLHHCLQIHIEDPQPGEPAIMIPIRF